MDKKKPKQRFKRDAQGRRLGRPQKRPDAARNARPRRVSITHGGDSRVLLRDPLDRRTRIGKAYRDHCQALSAHVGGEPTRPQAELIDQAARLALLAKIAWAELFRGGVFVNGTGQPAPALETWLKAARDQRAVLQLLGLERRSRDVTLSEYLQQTAEGDAE